MDTKRIDEYYKNDPEFKMFQEQMHQQAREFLDKEMENRDWRMLSLEEQAIQVAIIVYDLLKEGKTREDIIVELLRFRSVKYDPVFVDKLEEMYRKGLF